MLHSNSIPRLADDFFRGLEEQCKLRKERGKFGHDENGKPEVEWITKEREFMLQQVNIERAGLHKPAKTMADIRRVETMAMGHSDYTRKFAIYCAELVLLDKEP
jgi:hypothetical protein